MLLAGARQEELARLRLARVAQRGIFLQDLVHGRRHFLFILPGLGLDGETDERLGELDGRVMDDGGLVAQRVPGERLLQLPHHPDVAGVQLRHLGVLLALRDRDVLEALGHPAGVVLDGGVVLQDPAHHLEVADAPGEGVGQGLPHVDGDRLGVAHLAGDLLLLAFGLAGADRLAALHGVRQIVADEVQ